MANSSDFSECIRNGDRDAVARFMLRYRSRIVRRIRGKLRAAAITAVDAEDIFSSCARRIDLMVVAQRLPGMSDVDLPNYIFRMAMNVATDRIRAEQRPRRMLHRIGRDPSRSISSAPKSPPRVVQSIMRRLEQDDRHLLQLRLNGLTHARIADLLGLSRAAERARWQRLRRRVRSLLAPAAPEP